MSSSEASSTYRFSFAFNDERFNDRVLVLTKKALQFQSAVSTPLSLDELEPPIGMVVRRLHVSSILLASESTFFKAMLTNGMMESQSKEIELEVRVNPKLIKFTQKSCVIK